MSDPVIQAQITAIKEAIAVGALRITYKQLGEERTQEFRNLAEMFQILGWLEAQDHSVPQPSRRTLASFSNGTVPRAAWPRPHSIE